MPNKIKESVTFQKLGSQDFRRIANSVLNIEKSPLLPLFNGPEVLSYTFDKAKLFAEILSKNSNLMTTLPLYLFSLLELI